MVEVVCESQCDAARVGVAQRAADDRREVVREVEVVHRDVEGVLRRSDELGQCVGGVDGRLAAVGQCADFDRLYSRLAA